MMDMREKLVEIIQNSIGGCARYWAEIVADGLISHGGTVQEIGHWVYDFNLAGSNFYRCSVCNRQETLLEKEDIYEYCPFCHCGAKMMPNRRKENNNENNL